MQRRLSGVSRFWSHVLLALLIHHCYGDALSSGDVTAVETRVASIGRIAAVDDDYSKGISSCPCLPMEDERIIPIEQHTTESLETLGAQIDLKSYGFGCGLHDAPAQICVDGCSNGRTISPPPIDCDRSWCERNWCWVDPNNCSLLNKRSQLFGTYNRFYSYATCWDMDSFTQNNRLGSLQGKVLRVGFNSNSGGWIGAYSSTRESFKGPITRWSGPIVSFVTEAARTGNFWINLTEPPEVLRPHSLEYFGSSSFDYCVFTTALGYLDMCIAQYTVTDQRASTTEWLLLGSQNLHLVVLTEESESSNWQSFIESTATIFQPFKQSTWVFIVFFVIPILGCLMVVHEYGRAGSAYPKMESVVTISNGEKNDAESSQTKGHPHQEVKERRVPIYRHVIRSIYIGYLSVLQQNYSQSVVTYGAMLNLLGISFFILTIIAVYTANLAAILSQKPSFVTVSGIEEALSRGYRLCSERKSMEIVRALYSNLTTDNDFVVDPPELGGDGLPGFNCGNCNARKRVFARLNPLLADADPSYCHAAIAPTEDLDVEQQNGLYCNMSVVGDVVGQAQTGLPIFEGVSAEVISLLLKMKNDGVYDKELLAARPESQCPVEEGGEGSALSIEQLTGIWVVSFGFAFIGLVVTFASPRVERCRKSHVQSVIGYDQTGNRINILERCDSWIQDKTVVVNSKPVFVGEDSARGHPQGDSSDSKLPISTTDGSEEPMGQTRSSLSRLGLSWRQRSSRSAPMDSSSGDDGVADDNGGALSRFGRPLSFRKQRSSTMATI